MTGRALAAAGDARARDVLQRVAGDAGRAGAQGVHDAAGRELRRLGSRVSAPARRAARRDTTLSEREREIATLVSEGRSNKQVAAALFLSEKTIENALTTIYAKLGVRSRVELSLRFHLDGPAGVEQGVDDEHRGRRADGGEDLAVRRHRAFGVGGRGEERTGADNVDRRRRPLRPARRGRSPSSGGPVPPLTPGSRRRACTGPVPETSTRSPARTARLKPITGSYGEPDAIRRRFGVFASRASSARSRLHWRTST